MKAETKIILDTAPEAAQLVTVTGWVSSTGRFWGNDERAARYDGCTHKQCECGKLMERHWLKCEDCRGRASIGRYHSLPFKEWDWEEPVYSNYADRYFFSAEDIDDYLADNEDEVEAKDLCLVLCEPNDYRPVEYDYWSDAMPDDSDGELPEKLKDALKTLNEVIKTLPPASYSPGKWRTEYVPQKQAN